ncbi:hypothetical protein BT96DRAFT_1008141 [Gymnopus androsaceus JB14]|uniref:Uncharacterized protein n=1 Tax=Gymnopus androsaceus JB14 TaxID=1447944 RepID=A0A6A4GFW8_9AGAR|nr:hypothetical protein BT96DRAFT_1008141 [Gymnopus androsaceus JB14]
MGLSVAARNWRIKASQHGIQVLNNAKRSLMDEPCQVAFTRITAVSLASEQEEVLLPAPFMSTHSPSSIAVPSNTAISMLPAYEAEYPTVPLTRNPSTTTILAAAAPSSVVYYSPTDLLSPSRPSIAHGLAYLAMAHVLGLPIFRRLPSCTLQRTVQGLCAHSYSLRTTMRKACSICARKSPTLTRLAILAHIGHALCSSCSTTALNIVGGSAKSTTATASTTFSKPQVGVFDIMLSTPDGDHSFDFGSMDKPDFFSDGGIRASTPLSKAKGTRRASSLAVDVDKKEGRGAIVLRIDDVPWDITPPRISA